jgi:hypothetical protein
MKLLNTRLEVLLVCHAAAAQVITTFAGTTFSFPSQPLLAIEAPLALACVCNPSVGVAQNRLHRGGVAVDAKGDL